MIDVNGADVNALQADVNDTMEMHFKQHHIKIMRQLQSF
jgi:hypothetical protein